MRLFETWSLSFNLVAKACQSNSFTNHSREYWNLTSPSVHAWSALTVTPIPLLGIVHGSQKTQVERKSQPYRSNVWKWNLIEPQLTLFHWFQLGLAIEHNQTQQKIQPIKYNQIFGNQILIQLNTMIQNLEVQLGMITKHSIEQDSITYMHKSKCNLNRSLTSLGLVWQPLYYKGCFVSYT